MTVDREQIRRYAERMHSADRKIVHALLAEIEQAEKERDENERMANDWGDESVVWMRRANAAEARLGKGHALANALRALIAQLGDGIWKDVARKALTEWDRG